MVLKDHIKNKSTWVSIKKNDLQAGHAFHSIIFDIFINHLELLAADIVTKAYPIIDYANIKISVCEMIKNTPPEFLPFTNILHENFMKNLQYYKKHIKQKNKSKSNGSLIESPIYGMKLLSEYEVLLTDIEYVESMLKINDIGKINLSS